MPRSLSSKHEIKSLSIAGAIIAIAVIVTLVLRTNQVQQLISNASEDDKYWTGYWLNSGSGFLLSEHPSWKKVQPLGGIYPWTNNGPTLGYGTAANRVVVCNGNTCWQYDTKTESWMNNGTGFLLSEHPSWKKLKPLSGILPWTNGGPTASWRNGSVVATCNGQTCWQFDTNTQTWLKDGNAILLSEQEAWRKTRPENGIYPWSNGGPKVAWDTVRGRMAACNGDLCWQYDTEKKEWMFDGSPIHLSTHPSWIKIKAFNGVLPWTSGGPTASWGTTSGRTTVCNAGACWTYQHLQVSK